MHNLFKNHEFSVYYLRRLGSQNSTYQIVPLDFGKDFFDINYSFVKKKKTNIFYIFIFRALLVKEVDIV